MWRCVGRPTRWIGLRQWGRWPESVRERVCAGGWVSLYMPGHEAVLQTLGSLPGPLILGSVPTNGRPATTAEQVVDALGDAVALVIDDGPGLYGFEPTVVRFDGDAWQVRRQGAFPAAALEEMSPC